MSAIATTAPPERDLRMLCLFAIVVGYASLLAVAGMSGIWLFDRAGFPIPTDFVNVWAAGKLVLQGAPADAYDWTIHKGVEIVGTGQPFDGYFGWHYPPPFLLVAGALALLSYPAALVAWMVASLPLYLAAVWKIARSRGAMLAALAWPAVMWNVAVGQNGFLTAALLGGGLLLSEKKPLLAGVLIGLLTYKPQFGLLIPVALIAGGHWRVFIAAGVSAVALAALSALLLGVGPWVAFLHSAGHTNSAVMVDGMADFSKLLSLFGYVRSIGGSVTLAWTAHGLMVLALATGLVRLWRSEAGLSIKAAVLATATILASPYVYVYDLVVLAIPLAFLGRTGFSRTESMAIVVAGLLVLASPVEHVPTGLVASFIILGIAIVRLRTARPSSVGKAGLA